jgi:hypothetical protein
MKVHDGSNDNKRFLGDSVALKPKINLRAIKMDKLPVALYHL